MFLQPLMTHLIFCFYNIVLSVLLLQVSRISNELFVPDYLNKYACHSQDINHRRRHFISCKHYDSWKISAGLCRIGVSRRTHHDIEQEKDSGALEQCVNV